MQEKLDELSSSLSEYGHSMAHRSPSLSKQNITDTNIQTPNFVPPTKHSIPHLSQSTDNFISSESCQKTFAELEKLVFQSGKGRSTLKFGEEYLFNGSKGQSTNFPPFIEEIVDKINSELCGETKPLMNSCLVTKYVGPDSNIPAHSDDERSIHYDSDIITVSVGRDSIVRFTDKLTGLEAHTQKVAVGSVYVMSRRSQDVWSHQITPDPSWGATDTRYSLTFRSVHWRNNNSTLIMGDSNTKRLKFSKLGLKEGPSVMAGTFGNAMPGEQVCAYTVDEIDPLKCVGFNNIVLHSGINDIRQPDITEDDIMSIYVNLKCKIKSIKHINRRARIFVSPVLPTKDSGLNKKCVAFNSLLFRDLKSLGVYSIKGYNQFCDITSRLNDNLAAGASDSLPDIHITDKSRRLLSVCIKRSPFQQKKSSAGSRLQYNNNRRSQGGRQPD